MFWKDNTNFYRIIVLGSALLIVKLSGKEILIFQERMRGMEEVKLKEILNSIRNSNYQLTDDTSKKKITNLMLKYIGIIDPELRDDLIYMTFYHWIVADKDFYSNKELFEISRIAIDDQHLLYKLGEKGMDSVFTRTFSVLLVSLILHVDRERNFISKNLFDTIKETLFRYLQEERDIRGYVPVKGWAHGVAHAADAVGELVYQKYITEDDIEELLLLIRYKMSINDDIYKCQEDERMADSVVQIINTGLISEEKINDWLVSFKEIISKCDFVKDRHTIHNIKVFLKSLYFCILKNKQQKDLFSDRIKEIILQIS